MTKTTPEMRVWPGQPYPLGATWDGAGVNFAIFSGHAATHAVASDVDIRAARQRLHAPTSRSAARDARHLRGDGAPGGHRVSAQTRHHRRRAVAGASIHRRQRPRRTRADELLGL